MSAQSIKVEMKFPSVYDNNAGAQLAWAARLGSDASKLTLRHCCTIFVITSDDDDDNDDDDDDDEYDDDDDDGGYGWWVNWFIDWLVGWKEQLCNKWIWMCWISITWFCDSKTCNVHLNWFRDAAF